MSMPSSSPSAISRTRRVLLLLASTVALALSLACSSGGNTGAPLGVTPLVDFTVRLESGVGLVGLQVEAVYDSSLDLVSATPLGPLTSGTCQDNSANDFDRGGSACVGVPAFDGPASVFVLRFAAPEGADARALIFNLACTGTDELLNPTIEVCTLL